MNIATRNLHYPTMVPLDESTRPYRNALAWTPSGDGMASPQGNKKGVKKLRKILRDKKGIQTILAALLMVVIVVVASVMVYAWSTGLLGSLLVTPNTGKEALNKESATFNANNMNVTIYIRNTGSAAVSFTTYYVKDSAGNTYTQTAWTWGPTIQPNNVGLANIGIYTACGCGAVAGSGFTSFQSGNSYTVTVVTSRNSQFVFTVTR